MQALAPGVFRFCPIGMMSDQYRKPQARLGGASQCCSKPAVFGKLQPRQRSEAL
jgi:hypothetical protein